MSDAPTPESASAVDARKTEPIKLNVAIERAKEWLRATMAGERISNLGLEEVERRHGHWYITLGFSRPWDATQNAVAILSGEVVMRRIFKVITVDETSGDVVSMRNRDKE